jgi:hypothetical protein
MLCTSGERSRTRCTVAQVSAR